MCNPVTGAGRIEFSARLDEPSSAKDTRVLVTILAVVLRGRREGLRFAVGVMLPDVEVEGDLGLKAGDPLG